MSGNTDGLRLPSAQSGSGALINSRVKRRNERFQINIFCLATCFNGDKENYATAIRRGIIALKAKRALIHGEK